MAFDVLFMGNWLGWENSISQTGMGKLYQPDTRLCAIVQWIYWWELILDWLHHQHITQSCHQFVFIFTLIRCKLKLQSVLFSTTTRTHWFINHHVLDITDLIVFWLVTLKCYICPFPRTGQHIPQPLIYKSWGSGWYWTNSVTEWVHWGGSILQHKQELIN